MPGLQGQCLRAVWLRCCCRNAWALLLVVEVAGGRVRSSGREYGRRRVWSAMTATVTHVDGDGDVFGGVWVSVVVVVLRAMDVGSGSQGRRQGYCFSAVSQKAYFPIQFHFLCFR